MSTLVFVAPRGRAYCGRAVLMGSDGAVRAGPWRALATAGARVAKKHGNPDASPLQPFGHPPAGSYVVAGSLPPGWAHAHRARRFGRVGALLLQAQAGEALIAARNGRGLVASGATLLQPGPDEARQHGRAGDGPRHRRIMFEQPMVG